MDAYLGSANAFMLRVLAGMAVKVSLLFYMPFIPYMFHEDTVPNIMLLCMVVMGAGTWMIHGTASQVRLSEALFAPATLQNLPRHLLDHSLLLCRCCIVYSKAGPIKPLMRIYILSAPKDICPK